MPTLGQDWDSPFLSLGCIKAVAEICNSCVRVIRSSEVVTINNNDIGDLQATLQLNMPYIAMAIADRALTEECAWALFDLARVFRYYGIIDDEFTYGMVALGSCRLKWSSDLSISEIGNGLGFSNGA